MGWRKLEKLLANLGLAVVAQLTCLMRFGEMAWLTWDDVDDIANVLRIRPKEGWKPKTGDQRAVPLTTTLKQLLAALRKR